MGMKTVVKEKGGGDWGFCVFPKKLSDWLGVKSLTNHSIFLHSTPQVLTSLISRLMVGKFSAKIAEKKKVFPQNEQKKNHYDIKRNEYSVIKYNALSSYVHFCTNQMKMFHYIQSRNISRWVSLKNIFERRRNLISHKPCWRCLHRNFLMALSSRFWWKNREIGAGKTRAAAIFASNFLEVPIRLYGKSFCVKNCLSEI